MCEDIVKILLLNRCLECLLCCLRRCDGGVVMQVWMSCCLGCKVFVVLILERIEVLGGMWQRGMRLEGISLKVRWRNRLIGIGIFGRMMGYYSERTETLF